MKAIVAVCVKAQGGLSYEYLINAPLEELWIIISEINKLSK